MAINLDGSGGLFTRIGRFGKLLSLANTYQASIAAATDDILDEYDGDDRLITAGTIQAAGQLPLYPVAGLGPIAALCADTLLRMVRLDNPAAGGSIASALNEVIRQMKAGTETVKRATLGATATALASNVGDGQIVVSTVRGDGLPQENLIAETARVAATNDSYAAQSSAGAEIMGFFGSTDVSPTRLDYDWPKGSGVTTTFTAVSPDRIAADGTLLSNGEFDTFTVANTPDDWTIAVGTAGTHLFSEASEVYSGDKSLKLIGSATLVSLTQEVTLVPLTSYAFCLWIKRSAAAATGNLRIDVIDGSGTVLADEQATNNIVNADLTDTDFDAWFPVTGVFRLGREIPATVKFRIHMTTALETGRDVFLDRLSFTPMAVPYAGGPGVAVFGGATPFAAGDGWSVAFTNNAGGSTYGASFQRLFDRIFGMKELGLVLPSDASPSIADTLITS